MKERVFLTNNQDGIIENYWMMHFLNVTDVLTNRVNCSRSTFNLTLLWRVVQDLGALLGVISHCHWNIARLSVSGIETIRQKQSGQISSDWTNNYLFIGQWDGCFRFWYISFHGSVSNEIDQKVMKLMLLGLDFYFLFINNWFFLLMLFHQWSQSAINLLKFLEC